MEALRAWFDKWKVTDEDRFNAMAQAVHQVQPGIVMRQQLKRKTAHPYGYWRSLQVHAAADNVAMEIANLPHSRRRAARQGQVLEPAKAPSNEQ